MEKSLECLVRYYTNPVRIFSIEWGGNIPRKKTLSNTHFISPVKGSSESSILIHFIEFHCRSEIGILCIDVDLLGPMSRVPILQRPCTLGNCSFPMSRVPIVQWLKLLFSSLRWACLLYIGTIWINLAKLCSSLINLDTLKGPNRNLRGCMAALDHFKIQEYKSHRKR